MVDRPEFKNRIRAALRRAPIVALVGARQCGKTTLAKQIAESRSVTTFDLESPRDLGRLQNPEIALSSTTGLVIIDEIQRRTDLFPLLRVLVDRRPGSGRFLILGSASPLLIRGVSESLAGRVEFVDLSGFSIAETGIAQLDRLWLRGGLPRSYLARREADSLAWRESYIRTFLERDIPQLGISIPASAMRRFWTMLAHLHGQIWNAAELARSMGVDGKTVRSYLDILTATFMVRQLQPRFANLGKRQVKAPKVYLRDTGLLHALLGVPDRATLTAHPRVGASWEGFIVEQVCLALRSPEVHFWSTYQGAELDLLVTCGGRQYGIEVKYSESPQVTKSMHVALEDLNLAHLYVIYPGDQRYPADKKITMWPATELSQLPIK